MKQTLNLYKHLEHKQALRFSAAQGVYAGGGLFAALMLVALTLAVLSNSQVSRLKAGSARLENLQAELTTLQAGASNLASDTSVQELRDQVAQKRALLAAVGVTDRSPFSDYLAGLGRQHVEGLWLDQVLVKRRGEYIAIKGAMRKASLLPRYLQQLGNEQAFKGLRFQLMKIEEQPETQQQMRFEIAVVSDLEASADAGGES